MNDKLAVVKSRAAPLLLSFATAASLAPTAFASGPSTSLVKTATKFEDIQSIFEAIDTQVNVESVVAMLVNGVKLAIVLVFMWWGVRKLSKVVMTAFRKGRLSV